MYYLLLLEEYPWFLRDFYDLCPLLVIDLGPEGQAKVEVN